MFSGVICHSLLFTMSKRPLEADLIHNKERYIFNGRAATANGEHVLVTHILSFTDFALGVRLFSVLKKIAEASGNQLAHFLCEFQVAVEDRAYPEEEIDLDLDMRELHELLDSVGPECVEISAPDLQPYGAIKNGFTYLIDR